MSSVSPPHEEIAAAGRALERAAAALCAGTGAHEVWHLSFAMPCEVVPSPNEATAASDNLKHPFGVPDSGAAVGLDLGLGDGIGVVGAATCERPQYRLDPFEGQLRGARAVFDRLFGATEGFLVQDKKDLAAQARMRGEAEDADTEVLECALWKHLLARTEQLEQSNGLGSNEAKRLDELEATIVGWPQQQQ